MFTVYGAKIDNSFETSKRIQKKLVRQCVNTSEYRSYDTHNKKVGFQFRSQPFSYFWGEFVFLKTVDRSSDHQFVCFVPVSGNGLCHFLCNLSHFVFPFFSLVSSPLPEMTLICVILSFRLQRYTHSRVSTTFSIIFSGRICNW